MRLRIHLVLGLAFFILPPLKAQYISFEMIIEKTKESYYDVLEKSSEGWHEETNPRLYYQRIRTHISHQIPHRIFGEFLNIPP